MKKIYFLTFFTFLLFFFYTLFLSLNNKKLYNTEDIVGKKLTNIELEFFNKSGKFNTQNISNNEFTLINFWASWCGPCRREHKHLINLSKNENLKVIGINFKDDQSNAQKFLEELGNPFFILAKDTTGKKSINFGIYGIPETILVNQDLKILKKYVGPLDIKDVNEIKKIIKKLKKLFLY